MILFNLLFSSPKFYFVMRKQFKSIFFLLGIIIISMASCQDKANALVRSWKLEDLQYTKQIPDALKPTIQKSINDLKQSFVITYNADGTYQTKMKDQLLNGTWKLNYNSSKISVVTDGGQSKEYTILKLTPSSYSFKADENGQEVVFVMIPAN